MATEILKPSQVLRRVKSGVIADPQPKGVGRVFCEEFRHPLRGDTESPTYWENGDAVWCDTCQAWKLARVTFPGFEIDLRGERKQYPLTYLDKER